MALSASHLAAGTLLAAALMFAPADRQPAAGRVESRSTAEARLDAGALAPFMLFGWVSPPAESSSAARIAEYAHAGLSLMLPAWNDSGKRADNFARLDNAANNGMSCLIWDDRVSRFFTLDPLSTVGGALLDSITSDYAPRPGFGGYYLGDEPPASEFPLLASLHAALRARDPAHPAWNDLPPSPAFSTFDAWQLYVRAYLDTTHARVLCYNEYDFTNTGDRGLFVRHLAAASAIAREYGIPFWTIVQLIQHLIYRPLTDGEMRWQIGQALAYGARGIGYFTYWTPDPDSTLDWHYGMIAHDGQQSPWYGFLAALNPRVAATGRALANLTWLATVHSGSVPLGGTAFAPDGWIADVQGRAALGEFTDAVGARFVMAANSDSLNAQAVALSFAGNVSVERLSDDGATWIALDTTHVAAGTRAVLAFAAGDFAMLRVGGEAGPLRTGSGPGLSLAPNPARHGVSFALGHVRMHGHIEILDASGRRVWSHPLAQGSSIVTWDGTKDSGGLATPGIYFARAEDSGGVSASRLSWLGR
jgi:hypothetical protein